MLCCDFSVGFTHSCRSAQWSVVTQWMLLEKKYLDASNVYFEGQMKLVTSTVIQEMMFCEYQQKCGSVIVVCHGFLTGLRSG